MKKYHKKTFIIILQLDKVLDTLLRILMIIKTLFSF